MSIVKDVVSGIQGAKAADRSANAQIAGANEASAIQGVAKTEALAANKAGLEQSRADLQPFSDAGKEAISGLQAGLAGLSDLVTNPKAQADFITNNPFFDSLATRAKNDLFANQAAKGKVGSGGTAEALQNSLLLLGSDLINQNVTQRQNTNTQYQSLVNTGLSAAGTAANATNLSTARDLGVISDVADNQANLRVGAGVAQSAGIIGKYNARQGAADNVENTIIDAAKFAVQLCDIRMKDNIKKVGVLDNGLPIYTFTYKGSDKLQMNVMAQDVEKVMPHAVIERDGFKYVNMEQACQ